MVMSLWHSRPVFWRLVGDKLIGKLTADKKGRKEGGSTILTRGMSSSSMGLVNQGLSKLLRGACLTGLS